MNRVDCAAQESSSLSPIRQAVLTSFVGRQRDLAELRRLVPSSRLVTLTGPAGCGKSRLALRLSSDVAGQYPDGVHWIHLARLSDSTLVLQTVARSLRVPEQPGRPMLATLLDALEHRHLLLVLDNCEHVLAVTSQLAATLLESTPISILATSREPLGVSGERRYPVPPMALPSTDLSPRDMEQYDAIQLFLERARAVVPGFALTDENAPDVATICRRLDGMPLAIELASARVNVLSAWQISARLDDCFRLLTAAAHVTRSPHPSLRAAIEWSYDLLPEPEQIVLRRFAIFTGGWTFSAAEAVCAGDGIEREQVLELLSALVDKSLVVADTLQLHEARYALLETIRQFAREKLVASADWPVTCDRLIRHILQAAEETEPKLSGPDQQIWLSWIEVEYPNIRAALTLAVERRQIEEGLRIVNALYLYWTIRDDVQEGLAWLDRLLEQADERVALLVRAKALAYAAFMAGFRDRISDQIGYGREAALLAEAAGDEGRTALAWALGALAHGARAAGDVETELDLSRRVIQLRRELGDTYLLGLALSVYSPTATALGRYEEARAMLDEGLAHLRASGNPYRIAMALNYAGDLARCERKHARAQAAYEESVALLRDLDATRDLASVLHNLGHACLHRGDVGRAHSLFTESLAAQTSQRNTPGVAECLVGFAAIAAVCGLPAAGARLLAAAAAIGGQHIVSAWPATRMEYEHYLAMVRAGLTEAEFQAQLARGRSLTLEQAVESARTLPLPTVALRARKKPDDLTARERVVAALIAEGRSNAEIADELFVSKRTVEKHISNILSKLGYSNRAQIVRWALEAGLVQPPT